MHVTIGWLHRRELQGRDMKQEMNKKCWLEYHIAGNRLEYRERG